MSQTIESLLNKVKNHLKLPNDFLIEIYEMYPKDFISALCLPYISKGELKGAIIKIDYSLNKNSLAYLLTLFHELYHAKEYYEFYNRKKRVYKDMYDFLEEFDGESIKFSEIKADLYSLYLLLKFFKNCINYVFKQKI